MTTTVAVFTPPASPPPAGPPIVPPALATPQSELRTFRDAIRALSPPWLRRGTAQSILYAVAVQLDLLTDAARAALKSRFPGMYSNESLPLIGRERRIRRGRFESESTYASRLLPWLDHHRLRGGPYAMLAQLHAYYAPVNFPIELRYASGRNFVMSPADGSVLRGDVAWTPPGSAAQWARWWLYYQWPHPLGDDGVWSDPGTWDDGGVWDSNMAPSEVRDVRLIPREWNAAHAIGRIVLISTQDTIDISAEGI
jgi:hypothetical protein